MTKAYPTSRAQIWKSLMIIRMLSKFIERQWP